MMIGRRIVPALAALALVLGSAGMAGAQGPSYGVEEYNAYVETTPQQTQDPNQRLQAIEKFLRDYPDSVLRAFVYPNQAQTAFSLERYAQAIEAVNDFLAMDRPSVEELYRQSNYNDLNIANSYFTAHVLYAYSFLQLLSNEPSQARPLMDQAKQRAREGLQLHQQLYNQVSPPEDPQQRQQFEQEKQRAEGAFQSMLAPHAILANAAWQRKDYAAAAREYSLTLEQKPDDPAVNYRLGAASLQKKPPEPREGFWYLARAIALNINKSSDVRGYLTRALAGYQQVPPDCLSREVDRLIARARQSVRPPADWNLISADAVSALRQTMSVKTIFEELQKGGEDARLMFLASCGTEIGVGAGGRPELYVKVLEISQTPDNLVTLRVAAGQEAADAGRANIEVKVEGPPGARNLKADDVVRISGKISGYLTEPQFLLRLTEGQVHPEDLT